MCPIHRDETAMNGALDFLVGLGGQLQKQKATATATATAKAKAKANTGILRCAQNDDVKQATAKTKADPLRG